MTDLVAESNSENRDHSIIQVREEGERCEIEISDVGNQTLSGNETNKDELLASLIEKKLPQEFPKPDPTCIFRVPNKLGRDNENAFVPQVVPIGPYHHGGKKFEAMEQVKLWNLQCLLECKPTPDTSLVKFVKEIRSKEEFLRNCYDEKLGDHLSSDQFVEMMVVDGCFILELLRERNPISMHHDVFRMPEMLSIVQNDLLLLENQLPWKVLHCLFNLTEESGEISLHNFTPVLICKVTNNPFIDVYNILEIMDNERETWQFRHLLDNTRDLLVGSLSRKKNLLYGFWDPIPSVTHLEEIGVKFQLAPERTELLGITFNVKNGVMEIPLIIIGAHTESLFRNLIAYERCSMKPHYILSYAMLLNQLIKSTKDLDSLVRKDIVITDLTKEDTVSLFNRLCNDTAFIPLVYSQLSLDVYDYNRDRRLRRWLAGIKRDYLYNPSSIWSVSNAVIIILILTAMQTLYSVLAYYK
ncbi:hypothetical protein D8674_039568 [Pyrus ussuriensis x Pyrus communis]|uniref:Uncharacterized protein n=1 Tax=Pyrus ussuriensis x Pyrus communis TaxID=2448454 RepID=A0A5N5FMN3_9ROSA|nr:hypothetical protein D8674_039568 [Pyrus ussuriensis x Pyrus communis]